MSHDRTSDNLDSVDPISLLGNTELRQLLGVPADVLLKTVVSTEPPPLPTPHLSRASILSQIAKVFDSHRIGAVIGYPESGKTVALAEFASAYPGDVFWFSVAQSATHPDAWLAVLFYTLAQFLDAKSLNPGDIRASIAARQKPLLIVVDNAQHCNTLGGLSVLFEAANASPAVSVLLVGIDDPTLLSAVRTRGIVDWRLPGLTETEAQELIELATGSLSSDQKYALEFLRARVDGHLGMLKLSRPAIRNIATREQRAVFIAQTLSSLGSGLDSLQAAMIERLRAGLTEDEIELCRRLSLVIGAFPMRVAEHVWSVDRPQSGFHATWNQCVVRLFEPQRSGRYTVPDLYRDGFRKETHQDSLPAFHNAIADAFQKTDGHGLNVFDVQAAVFHRVMSGDAAVALESAATYLAIATSPKSRSVQDFLIQRFELWLAAAAHRSDVPVALRIRWHAICARVYADLGRLEKERSAIAVLEKLLRKGSENIPAEVSTLGWSIILMHAASAGEPQMAIAAANELEAVPTEIGDTTSESIPFLVLSAYFKSSDNPLSYLRSLISQCKCGTYTRPLWGKMTEYAFWRLAIASVYSRSSNDTLDRPSPSLVESVNVLAADLEALGELEVSCLMRCLLAHIYIDIERDFVTATTVAEQTVHMVRPALDMRIVAYVHDTLGDALRCAGRDEEAACWYQKALEMCPVAEVPDRAETLMMLGISRAKAGQFHEGAIAARAAAKLHLQGNRSTSVSPSPPSATRCLLEAAVISLHGMKYAESLRSLIKAHGILSNLLPNYAEWPALGQIAWSLVNRVNPDPIDPQPPAPGFTLALEGKMAGAEKMMETAPTLMLGRACSALGRGNRAMHYFNCMLADCADDAMRTQIGIMALDAAILAEDVVAAAKYAAIGSQWLTNPLPGSPDGIDSFVFDYLIGRVVRIAAAHYSAKDSPHVFHNALAAVGAVPVDNRATKLLKVVLEAFHRSNEVIDGASLESAIRFANENRALVVAKEIAWLWCYRFSIGRSLFAADYYLWHWRLCWLSSEIAPNDLPFVERVEEQERAFWTSIPEVLRTGGTQVVVDLLEAHSSNTLPRLTGELAAAACSTCNLTDASQELAIQLRLASDATYLTKAVDTLYIRILDLLLHPGAPHLHSQLQGDVAPLLIGARSARCAGTRVVDKCMDLEALSGVLGGQRPTERAFVALRSALSSATKLSTNSTAQLYIWLRHFIQCAPADFRFDKVSEILNSDHVAEVLLRPDLLPYLRIRLAVCHLTAKGFGEKQRLAHALTSIASQREMRSPIAVTAIVAAEREHDRALAGIRAIAIEFESLEAQVRDAGHNDELWSCCNELGGLRRMVGTILLVQALDDTAMELWLRPALDDFRRAIEAAKLWETEDKNELVLKSAFSGRTVAAKLEDQPAFDELSREIEQIRNKGGFDALIVEQEALEADDILIRKKSAREDRFGFLRPGDEAAIQYFTNQIMESTGWPPDRRRHVEDDVRKMARVEQEQQEYCQYLQPLQNLLHNRSPSTVYASPTLYTCSCTLLNYQTQIEVSDIETVLDAMKRVYCNECDQRSPRESK